MKTNYTPGPWGVEKTSSGQFLILGPHTEGFNYRGEPISGRPPVVSIAFTIDCISKNESIANARLIAAAPDMLEALRGMLEWARRVKEGNPGPEISNAISAISKALGE